mgnify:CR=1 FL=1
MEKAIITVLGKDTVGIIAAVCTYLAENRVNILDISQTITGGFFNMMMITDISNSKVKFTELVDGINEIGDKLGMQIRMQKEDIFDAMHRI